MPVRKSRVRKSGAAKKTRAPRAPSEYNKFVKRWFAAHPTSNAVAGIKAAAKAWRASGRRASAGRRVSSGRRAAPKRRKSSGKRKTPLALALALPFWQPVIGS